MITRSVNPNIDRIPVSTTAANDIPNEPIVRFYRSLCWKAIFAGTAAAIGINLLLLTLGAAIGLASFTPLTDQNPAESFTIGTAIAWGLCALVSLYVGGWIAGCFSAGPKTGSIHGIVVWSVTMAITFLLASTGGGLAMGGVVKALGASLGMTGTAAASGGVRDDQTGFWACEEIGGF
jgi:hypothetical protein